MNRLTLVAALALVGALSSCSGGSQATPVEPPAIVTTQQPNGPDCSEVWALGQVLPVDYQGCLDGDRVWPATIRGDEVVYGRFTARPGGAILRDCEQPPPGQDKTECARRNAVVAIDAATGDLR